MLRETVGKLEHGRSWLEERMEALEARLAALTPDLKVPTTMRFVCYNFSTSKAMKIICLRVFESFLFSAPNS